MIGMFESIKGEVRRRIGWFGVPMVVLALLVRLCLGLLFSLLIVAWFNLFLTEVLSIRMSDNVFVTLGVLGLFTFLLFLLAVLPLFFKTQTRRSMMLGFRRAGRADDLIALALYMSPSMPTRSESVVQQPARTSRKAIFKNWLTWLLLCGFLTGFLGSLTAITIGGSEAAGYFALLASVSLLLILLRSNYVKENGKTEKSPTA